jgi:glycosyltransferase involved in cell wall biosynthesis
MSVLIRLADRWRSIIVPEVLLIANYRPDGQQSMLRSAELLERELHASGFKVRVARPEPVFGRLVAGQTGIAKWLAYLDKYLLFPFCLVWEARRFELVHIVDHSNAVYVFWLAGKKSVVTCNDLLAVRSALGEIPEQKTGLTGRWLQKWILAGLRRANRIACISDATRRDVLRLTGKSEKEVSTIYLGLEPIFEAELDRNQSAPANGESDSRDHRPSLHASPSYILHVGGDTWYKNRPGVLRIYQEVRRRMGGAEPDLIMVGSPLQPEVHGVRYLRNVTDAVLLNLYRQAALLLFPSFYEGFGWPVVEAHACGCPAVITGTAPLTEAAGNAAIWITNPRDIDQAADRVMEVLRADRVERQRRQKAGYENARRFSRGEMAAKYRELYASMLSE